jgi:hypothetical protein
MTIGNLEIVFRGIFENLRHGSATVYVLSASFIYSQLPLFLGIYGVFETV